MISAKFTVVILCIFSTVYSNSPSVSASVKADSISSIEKINLGGFKQTVMIHGKNSLKPVLLLLHGGPGFVETYLFRTYNRILEDSFTVVYWDQRGTGLSYSPNIPPQTMTLNQIIADAHELTGILKKRFNKQKIYLLGHSWGSALGINLIQRYPQDYYKYAGVGQIVDMVQNEKLSFKYALDAAIKDRNKKAISELKKIEKNYNSKAPGDLADLYVERKWLDYYGGAVYNQKNADKIYNGITASEYRMYDKKISDEGQKFSMKFMWEDVMKINFFNTATTLRVPVYFFTGRHDYNAVNSLVENYYDVLQAPHKEIIWFENSAHLIPFEEPYKFNKLIVERLLQE